MQKLIYILPEAAKNTHMKYNVEFIESLAKEKKVDIFLIIERGIIDENLKEKLGVKYLKFTGNKNSILRIFLLKIYLWQAVFFGYRKAYIHYSFIGAILASLNPFIKTYYWNCGIPWKYKRPFLQELYESTSYKLINHFVTGAEVLTKKYSEFYKFNNKKSIVIPNWIDINYFQNIFNSSDKETIKKELEINDQKVLFFNQRLAERKGAHYIPAILKTLVKNNFTDFVIIITNDGPYKEKLIEELKQNDLLKFTRLLGRVPNDRVVELLSIVDIYILPSEEEGMSHSLMEAMCAGVAAVSFDVGGTKDMYPCSFKEFVVKELDIKTFTEKVINILNDKSLQENLGGALKNKVLEYDKKIVLDEFVKKILN